MDALLVIRTDAGPQIGLGHAMRCLAIAQAWIEAHGRVLFVMARGAETLQRRAMREEIAITTVEAEPGTPDDIDATIRIAKRSDAAVVMLDGYAFGLDFQEAIVDARLPCAVVDDHARLMRYAADVVVDANVTANTALLTERSPRARVLAGASYALIRREFVSAPCVRARRNTKRLLVTFGGSDPARLTERALAALDPTTETCVLVGAANLRLTEIAAAAQRLPNSRVLQDALNAAEHMAWADLALVAAGSTCAELAFMGLPAIGIVAAENQRPVARGFERLGTMRVLGEAEHLTGEMMMRAVADLTADAAARQQMTVRGQAAIDGQGATRVARVLREATS